MRRPWVPGVIVSIAVSMAGPLQAQRPSPPVYDTQRIVRLEGAVTRVDWVTPRAFIYLNAAGADGTVANWAIRVASPQELERGGWKQSTLRVGDVVVVEASPARGASQQASARSVRLKKGNQRLFAVNAPGRGVTGAASASAAPGSLMATAPAPRWPDGHVRLGAEPGRTGYWGAASATALVERGVSVRMNDEGILANLADADRVAPFQPWARAVYVYRQRTRLKDDPLGKCFPPGGPRQFLAPGGFQFVEQPALGRILVLMGGGNRNWRVIHTDGRPAEQAAEAVLTFYGTSVGRWDRDTLVVESAGYNERFWFSNGGLPHTEALRLVERFSRPSMGTLRYEVTVDDPRTYTRPWTGGWTVQWVPDAEIQESFCEDAPELPGR